MSTYNVYRDGAKIKEGLTATTYTDTGLTPNKTYSYQVSAQNAKGESALSEPLEVKTPYTAPTGVTLDKTTLALETGATSTLVAAVAPSTANQGITWKTNDATIATVDTSGKVVAVKAGTVTITAESKQDATKKATCAVSITNPVVAVTGVSLNKTTTSIAVGAEETLTATVTPANATNKAVTYTSSDAAIATVTNAGKVTGVSEGEATITVKTTDGNKTAACIVTVTA